MPCRGHVSYLWQLIDVINILAQASFRLWSCRQIASCPSILLCFRTCSPFPTVMLSFTSPSPFISRISWTYEKTVRKIYEIAYALQNVSRQHCEPNNCISGTHYLLTCTRPSLFSRVSLFPTVLLSEARRSWTPLSQVQVACSVSSKACCSCKVSWQLRSLSLTRLSKAWCCDWSWAETLVSLPSPRPPSLSACPSWQRRSNESLHVGR